MLRVPVVLAVVLVGTLVLSTVVDGDKDVVTSTALETVARTLYGEARSASEKDRLGVLAVIRERVLRPGWWGYDWETVCRMPWQFTSWSDIDDEHIRNLRAMMVAETADPKVWSEMVELADYAIRGMTDDGVAELFHVKGPDDHPTHYHDRGLSGPPASWGKVREIYPRWEGSLFRWYVIEDHRPKRKG